jgi:hypothetical protein
MRVAVVELMPAGHLEVVESLIHIHLSDPRNTVCLFATERICREIQSVFDTHTRLEYSAKTDQEPIRTALDRIPAFGPDKIYVATIERQIDIFADQAWTAPVCFVIHNIDYWFSISWWQNVVQLFKYLNQPGGWSQWRYLTKIWLAYRPAKRRWMQHLLSAPNRVAVINDALAQRLTTYAPAERIETIPAAVRNTRLSDKSQPLPLLQLCIPGYVTQVRRDYLGLFRWLLAEADTFRSVVQIECLGKFDHNHIQTAEISELIEHCRAKGLQIVTHEAFIPVRDYDEALMQCDLILANINQTGSYGENKDTGGIFMMIKAGKPGLIPANYPIQPEIRDMMLIYNSYPALGECLLQLHRNRPALDRLKQTADGCTQYFAPEKVYQRIYSR